METVWVRSKWIVLWRLGPDGKPLYVGPSVHMAWSNIQGELVYLGEK